MHTLTKLFKWSASVLHPVLQKKIERKDCPLSARDKNLLRCQRDRDMPPAFWNIDTHFSNQRKQLWPERWSTLANLIRPANISVLTVWSWLEEEPDAGFNTGPQIYQPPFDMGFKNYPWISQSTFLRGSVFGCSSVMLLPFSTCSHWYLPDETIYLKNA